MADNKMKTDDMKRNVGSQENKDAGQHSPGRNPKDDRSTGQRSRSGNEPQKGATGNEGRGGHQGDDDIQRR